MYSWEMSDTGLMNTDRNYNSNDEESEINN
jgi:hypothetical protein